MQYLYEKDKKSNHILAVLYKISPTAFLTLFPAALFFEGGSFIGSPFVTGTGDGHLQTQAILLCLSGGILAVILIFTEISLMKATSSLTLTVLGQVKEIIQILLAMIVFNENLSIKSIIGISGALLAGGYYRQIKVSELQEQLSSRVAVDRADQSNKEAEKLLDNSSSLMTHKVNSYSKVEVNISMMYSWNI